MYNLDMKEKCGCCKLDIYYDDKGSTPGNVIVLPLVSVRSAYVQKAIHQGDAGLLPAACRQECADKCKAATIIAKFQPSKE